MKALVRTLVFFVIAFAVALVIAGVYGANQYLSYYHNRPPVLPPSLSASPSATSTAFSGEPSAPVSAFAAYLARPKVLSSLDVSAWKMYESPAYGYGIQYPSDVTVSEQGSSTVFAFSSSAYFHWPLLDTVKVTVVADQACPSLTLSGPPPLSYGTSAAQNATSTLVDIGGYGFTRRAGGDVGAGNLYSEAAYDTQGNGLCYHIDFLDHGTNGAGFYVGDQDLIARYDAQHEQDMSAVLDIFDAMVTSFRIRTIQG